MLMKNLRIWVGVLVLTALLAGIGPVMPAPVSGSSISSPQVCEKNKGRDDPWDPGEESKSAGDIEAMVASANYIFTVRATDNPDIILAHRKDDDPWDPGDESGHKSGVRHV
jgi:hypothetical protein